MGIIIIYTSNLLLLYKSKVTALLMLIYNFLSRSLVFAEIFEVSWDYNFNDFLDDRIVPVKLFAQRVDF